MFLCKWEKDFVQRLTKNAFDEGILKIIRSVHLIKIYHNDNDAQSSFFRQIFHREHTAGVLCVTSSTNNSLIISGGDDSNIIISAATTGKVVSIYAFFFRPFIITKKISKYVRYGHGIINNFH